MIPGQANTETDQTLALTWLTTDKKYRHVGGILQTNVRSAESEAPITVVFGEFKLSIDRYRARRVGLIQDNLDADSKVRELDISTSLSPLLTVSGITLAFLFEYDWFKWLEDVKDNFEVLKGLVFTANYLNCPHIIRHVVCLMADLIDRKGAADQLQSGGDYMGEEFPSVLRQLVVHRSLQTLGHLYVKTLSGRSIMLNVPLGASIIQIKEMIWAQEHYPPEQQRLVICGAEMDDSFVATTKDRNNAAIFAYLVLKKEWASWPPDKSSRVNRTSQGIGQFNS